MVLPQNLNKLQSYLAPMGGETIQDPYPGQAGEDIDIDQGRQYALVPIQLMPHTNHKLKMGDKLKYSVTGWSHSGPYVSVFKTAPVSSNYNFGPHGYGRRANTRTIGYLKRSGYRAITNMQHTTQQHGLRPGLSSAQKVDLYFIGEYSTWAANQGAMPWSQIFPTRYANPGQQAWAVAVV